MFESLSRQVYEEITRILKEGMHDRKYIQLEFD